MDFKVGQKWRRRNKKEGVITKICWDEIFCDDSIVTNLDGRFRSDGSDDLYDLVDLIADVSVPECPPASSSLGPEYHLGTAPWYLSESSKKIAERGAEYDVPGGERSMASVVVAFNALRNIEGEEAGPLTTTQGWLFMALVKMKRLLTVEAAGGYHEDSAIDLIAYCALAAEAARK